MLSAPVMLGLCVMLQDPTLLPPPPADEPPPPPATTFAPTTPEAPPPLPPEVADQLIGFETEKVVEIQQDPVQVRVMGQGRVGTLKIKNVKTPVLGRHRREMSWTDFYTLVGRKDLGKNHALLKLSGMSLTLGGLAASLGSGLPFTAAMLAGLGLIFWERGGISNGPVSSNSMTPMTLVGIGVILAGAAVMTLMILGGTAMMWISRQVPDHPVDNADLVELAEAHNRGVLERAGLPASAAPPLAP